MRRPHTFILPETERIPNSELPVLFYEGALQGDDLTKEARRTFTRNGWGGQWEAGIYGYHHFHSNAHEALAIVGGSAIVVLGGEGGKQLSVAKGDVLVLPSGTGHRRIHDSPDFWVVGAYPQGQEAFDEYIDKSMCANYRNRLRAVPLPDTDPLYGTEGPLPQLWTKHYVRADSSD